MEGDLSSIAYIVNIKQISLQCLHWRLMNIAQALAIRGEPDSDKKMLGCLSIF